MGFSSGGVWVTGYGRPMGYGMHFPAHQVGGLAELLDITGSTVTSYAVTFVPVENSEGP